MWIKSIYKSVKIDWKFANKKVSPESNCCTHRGFCVFQGKFAGLSQKGFFLPLLAVCQPKLAVKKSLKNLNMGEEGTYEKRIN